MGEIRDLRNDVAHVNPDPLPPAMVGHLRHFLALVRRYAGEVQT